MNRDLYRYTFSPELPAEEIEAALVLALLATESLHGESQTRLDAAHYVDGAHHVCVVDALTRVGKDLNRLFVGFLRREFSPDSFRVERIDAVEMPQRSTMPAAS